jgi:NADH-quinone oxidoreductase subunit N
MDAFFTILKQELLLTAIIFLLLLIKLGKGMSNMLLLQLIQTALLINAVAGFFWQVDGDLFDTMYHTSPLIALQKNILNICVYVISLIFTDWYKQHKHLPEFFVLLLSAMLGMFFMLSAGNFLMFYLALELATIPLAAIANFDLDKKQSGEAAMKMILSVAFSSGILLFGISILYGVTGTINFKEIPALLSGNNLQIIAFVFVVTAFAFKLSVVPFHFWTADVYQGAPMPTTAFLSVVSKGAIAFVFVSVLYNMFKPLAGVWYNLIALLAVITMLTGNIFALRQQNIKRFLAFSSIAQVGFILVGISNGGAAGHAAVIFFVLVYAVSNLAAFGVAAIISNAANKENIDEYKGMYKTNPLLSWIMALALFSLAGIPPTGGFFGKLFLISAGAAKGSYIFIIIAALNMIISLYYYLKVVRAIFMDKNENPIAPISINGYTKLGLLMCSAGIVLMGVLSWIYEYIQGMVG